METHVISRLLGYGIIGILISCQSKQKAMVIPASFDWLEGRWLSSKGDKSIVEHWKKTDRFLYEGEGLFLSGLDTLSREFLSLKFIQDRLYYCATVPNQNEGKTITFKLTSQTDSSFVFTNPKHDYPQSIRYVKHDKHHMTVTIATLQQSNKQSQNFTFVRQEEHEF